MTNMIMGPPIFAPLLFGTGAYLGLMASYLQREESHGNENGAGEDIGRPRMLPSSASRELLSDEEMFARGRFQRQVAIMAGVSALLSGFEAYYSHYKNNFRYKVQWSPIIIAPILAASAFASAGSRRAAATILPAAWRWRRLMPPLAFTTICAACYGGRVAGHTLCTTLFTGRLSLRRCFLVRRAFLDLWPVYCDGDTRE